MSFSTEFAPETYREKAERKFKENPFVPIGAIATSAALAMAMVRMRKGDAKSFNHWLRMRVVFQGLTIAAVCAGTYSFGLRKNPNPELSGDEERRRQEEKVLRNRLDFEMRMREAEANAAEGEAGFAKIAADNKGKGSSLTQEEKVARERAIRKGLSNRADSEVPVSFDSTTSSPSPSEKGSGGWKSWFGL